MTFEDIRQTANETAQANIFAHGTVPDGPDRRASVDFALVGGHIMTVYPRGCYDAGLPPVLGVAEAVWMLQNHPTARGITVTRVLH